MLVRDFVVKTGQRKFRAIIAEKDSAEELYKLARERGFNALTVSQEVFSDMLVKTSLKEKSNIDILFSYTQLTSLEGKKRVFAIPSFKGLENSSFQMKVNGSFLSPLISLTGLNANVKKKQFSLNVNDKETLDDGLLIKYETEGDAPVSADRETAIIWNSSFKNYQRIELEKSTKFSLCADEIIRPAFDFLKLYEMILKDRPFKEIQAFSHRIKITDTGNSSSSYRFIKVKSPE